MIIVELKGGMGNQMFQYAAAKSLCEKFNEHLILNTYYFDNLPNGDTPRQFQLNIFNIPEHEQISIKNPNTTFYRIIKRIFNEKARFKLNFILLWLKITIILDGYYQSETYFSKIRDLLLKEFEIKKKMSISAQKIIGTVKDSESVCVNIRRGDYLRTDYANIFGLCSLEYYQNALSLMFKKINNPLICFISDDPEWVKENFKFKNAIYAGTDILKDYEQMVVMSCCKHNIIANSSFSWWGAWLNQNPNKIVIAPKQWTTKQTSDELNILPKEWIQM